MSHPINSLYLIKRLGLELTRANIPGILGNNNTEVQYVQYMHPFIADLLTFSENIERKK